MANYFLSYFYFISQNMHTNEGKLNAGYRAQTKHLIRWINKFKNENTKRREHARLFLTTKILSIKLSNIYIYIHRCMHAVTWKSVVIGWIYQRKDKKKWCYLVSLSKIFVIETKCEQHLSVSVCSYLFCNCSTTFQMNHTHRTAHRIPISFQSDTLSFFLCVLTTREIYSIDR